MTLRLKHALCHAVVVFLKNACFLFVAPIIWRLFTVFIRVKKTGG